jgi:hypothetical protein
MNLKDRPQIAREGCPRFNARPALSQFHLLHRLLCHNPIDIAFRRAIVRINNGYRHRRPVTKLSPAGTAENRQRRNPG